MLSSFIYPKTVSIAVDLIKNEIFIYRIFFYENICSHSFLAFKWRLRLFTDIHSNLSSQNIEKVINTRRKISPRHQQRSIHERTHPGAIKPIGNNPFAEAFKSEGLTFIFSRPLFVFSHFCSHKLICFSTGGRQIFLFIH